MCSDSKMFLIAPTHVVLCSFAVDVVLNVPPAYSVQCELSCCTTQTTSICTNRLVWGYCVQ